jgi:recombinase
MQQVIALVFSTFEALGSCYRVMRDCQQHDLLVPRRLRGSEEAGDIRWRRPSAAIMSSILTNPAYAGAFVYGRRTSDAQRPLAGRHTPATGRRSMEAWHWVIQDASPASMSWAQYLANQERLRANAQHYRAPMARRRGAPREGAALLQGLITWGRCGYRRHVASRPRSRSPCTAMPRTGAAPRGVHRAGPPMAACVVQAFFDAMAPAQLEALDEVLAQRQRDHHRLETDYQQQVAQARFSAALARRRYEHGETAYRLAAAALDRAWEDTLRALRQAAEAAGRFAQTPAEPPLSPELREHLRHLRRSLPAWWAREPLRHDQRPALLRRLSSQGIVKRTAADRVAVKSIWVRGHVSQGIVIPPVLPQRPVTGDDTLVERTRQLWSEGYTDAQIAEPLSRAGLRSARRAQVVPRTVLKRRTQHQWVRRDHQHRFADKMDAMWPIHGLARHLGVEREWLSHRLRPGTLREPEVIRKPPYGNYLIHDDPALLARLRAEVQRSRRWGRDAATGAISPERGASPAHPVTRASSAAVRARTSRTNRSAQEATSDA